MDDLKIIDLFFRREEAAIQCVADKYGKRLRALSYGIVQDLQTAEECENDTYLKAWNTIPPNDPKEYLYLFLARIARHLSLDRCRTNNRLKRSAFMCELSAEMEQCIPAPGNVEHQIDDLAFAEALNRFLRSLNAEKRNIFIRRYWYLDSIKDISGRYGYSESKIKTTLFRIRKEIQIFLKKEGYNI